MELTAKTVKTLTLPPGVKDKVFWDDTVPGFGVRVRAGGSHTFRVQYDIGGRTRGMTLGPVGLLDLGKARTRAKEILAAVRLGRDPAYEKHEARERARETFGALLLERYLPLKQAQLRPRSFVEVERHLGKYARPLHARPVASIDQRTIARLASDITIKAGPVAANAMLGSLSGYIGWLIGEGLYERANPVGAVNKAPQSKGRERLLLDVETAEIWQALTDSDYSDIVRLLLLTLARKAEIGGLQWSEVDLDAAEIHLPANRVKNGRPHIIPLSLPALTILKARWLAREPDAVAVFGRTLRGFGNWSGSKRELDRRIAEARQKVGIVESMPPWVVHDFRRYGSTTLHDRFGIAPHIVESLLGHIAGFKSGVSGVYNKASYLDERRRVLERWATFVEEVTTGKRTGKVVPLRIA